MQINRSGHSGYAIMSNVPRVPHVSENGKSDFEGTIDTLLKNTRKYLHKPDINLMSVLNIMQKN